MEQPARDKIQRGTRFARKPGEPAPRLGDLLVEQGVLTRAQLSEALLKQNASGKRIGTLLLELGLVEEDDLIITLSEQLGIPIADLHRLTPTEDALALIPETIARSTTAIPLSIEGGTLRIAIADPTQEASRAALAEAAGLELDALIASPTDIERVIDSSYRALSGIDAYVEAFTESEARRRSDRPELETITEDSPVVRIVDLLLTQARRDRASDIHIEPTDRSVRVRYRIDGALHDAVSFPADLGPAIVSRIKIMGGMNIVERRRPQDGQFSLDLDGKDLDVRVSTTATIWGEKAVLRLLTKSEVPITLAELGMPRDDGDPATADIGHLYREIIRSPFGMVVVAGPTGSGKTTTLYATIDEINRTDRNIMTIEDPVEYVLPSVNQLQINEAAGVNFAAGLKSILRQDPDVILVGEMRDAETARLGVQSALTGHFVLSTIHATDAASALQRFLDMEIEPFLVASSMLAMVSQRLVRRVCKHCKVAYKPSAEELAFYEDSGGPAKDPFEFVRGEGCNFCARTGYRGRVAVFELLRITDEIKRLVLAKASHEELRATAIEQGMVPMRRAAMEQVAQGTTTIDEVLRAIYLL